MLAKILYVQSAAAGKVDSFEDDGHPQAEAADEEEERGLKVKTFNIGLFRLLQSGTDQREHPQCQILKHLHQTKPSPQ